jgi:asparagine synthase (glutamine-hydrolysing)
MCGILAIATYRGRVSPDGLRAGLEAIAHRGPDSAGTKLHTVGEGEVALGHCRLSIFDLSAAGAQPMRYWARSIIFNGSIFNWPELRRELEGFGYSFATQTDTEVILAAYDKWGSDCVTRFNGFWAFAILDERRQGEAPALFLSRDRFGIKPLYFTARPDRFVLASEIKPIYASLHERPSINFPELSRQLVYRTSDDSDRTIYDAITELEPATSGYLDLSNGKLTQWRYWSLQPEARFEGTVEQALGRFSELFEDSVRIRLRADREVALMLSGGVDSSAIAVAISRTSSVKVRTFTSHYPDRPDIDESGYAAIVARKLGMEHILVQPDMTRIAREERRLSRHQELMYGSFSLLMSWFIMNEIQKTGVRIFLTGQGGDELFLGYERYYTAYLKRILRTNPTAFMTEVRNIGENSALGVKGTLAYLLYFSGHKLRSFRYRREARQVFSRALLSPRDGEFKQLSSALFELQKDEVCGYQLRHLLRYDDRTAAAFGMEGRPAFLDHRLAEFAVSLDWRHKIRGGWTKYILRQYLDRAGLPEIAWRKHKLGFNAPTLDWTNALFPGLGELASAPGHNLLRQGLTVEAIPDRMRFAVYNLLSTAREMNWEA